MYSNENDKIPKPTASGKTESLDSYIKRLRLSLHLSQQELAERAGIHLHSIGKLERGTRQRLNQKTKNGLAAALDIPTEYLEAVSQGRPIDVAIIKKFCPNCWVPGTQPEQAWTLQRAHYCFICGLKLHSSCTGCGEAFTSFKHKFCPNCGIPYKPKKIPNS
jgi:transcriptional regulator with XRE-family HTH domain